ncbi:hypothetical protein [Tabrizicola sp.]|uniref:hypothetical protein n=1 Tax=Tabrizicola sp. TaxID=2005166 RepID=UPI003F342617
MYPVNLDLLHASAAHNPDGSPKDLHAHHRAELIAIQRAERRARWQGRVNWLMSRVQRPPAVKAPLHANLRLRDQV